MITENGLRGLMILVGFSACGCAALAGYVTTPSEPLGRKLVAPGCPYASVYVAAATNGLKRDQQVASRVRIAYSEYLGQQGFSIVAAPEEAYWSAFSLVRLSRRVDSSFAWAVYMMATQDDRGQVQTPIEFAAADDEEAELSGFMLLREVRLLELDLAVRRAAENTADALVPHASRMCIAWNTEPQGEVAARDLGQGQQRESGSIERLRKELEREIVRVRRERQQKLLQVGVDGPADL